MIPSYTTGIGLIEDDVWFYTMPFHTIAGMGMQLALLSLCNTIVYPFKTDPAARSRLRRRARHVVGQTPTFYLQLMGAPGFDDADRSAFRRCITYGGTMPQSMFDAFGRAAPDAGWGTYWAQSELTQMRTIGRFRSLDDIPGGDPSWIGKPATQLEVRVVDEDGNDAPEGELPCRSPALMLGYHNDPEQTAAVFARRLAAHRRHRPHRRRRQPLLPRPEQRHDQVGGMNVSSRRSSGSSTPPRRAAAAVVGLRRRRTGPRRSPRSSSRAPAPRRTRRPSIAFCREQLAGYKVPKAVHVIDELPVDAQGKILKRELRPPGRARGLSSAGRRPARRRQEPVDDEAAVLIGHLLDRQRAGIAEPVVDAVSTQPEDRESGEPRIDRQRSDRRSHRTRCAIHRPLIPPPAAAGLGVAHRVDGTERRHLGSDTFCSTRCSRK